MEAKVLSNFHATLRWIGRLLSVQYGKCNYPFISNLVKSKCQGYLMQQEKDEENQASALPLHENIRGAQAYK